MTVSAWLGVLALVAMVAFIVFAFRQGRRVQPDTTRRIEDFQDRFSLAGILPP